MLAYYVHHLSPYILEIRPGFGLHWYGFAYVLAFVCGFYLYRWLAQHGYSEMKPDQVGDFITWGAIFGVMLGGRIGWILLYGVSEDHTDDPWWWPLEVWKGGMASHGGMIGLILFTLFYARRHNLSWTGIGDNLCVVAPVGLFFGRLANFVNGELYGRVATVPWAMKFPDELNHSDALANRAFELARGFDPSVTRISEIIAAARSNEQLRASLGEILTPRHPSQLYEAFLEGAVLFTILWVLRTRFRIPRGVLTGLFFILYAAFRIIGEIFREPEVFNFGLTRGQFLSLFLVLIGIAFVTWGVRAGEYESGTRKA